MSRKILLVVKSSPYGSLVATEALRIATAMIAMDVLPKLLFVEDGVYCLLKNQRPEAAGLDSYHERLKTLADLVGLHAVVDSLTKRDLKITNIDDGFNVNLLSTDETAQLIMENEVVIAF